MEFVNILLFKTINCYSALVSARDYARVNVDFVNHISISREQYFLLDSVLIGTIDVYAKFHDDHSLTNKQTNFIS